MLDMFQCGLADDERSVTKKIASRVSAVILNYCNPGDTVSAIRSVLESNVVTDRVIVVDNASPDDSASVLSGCLSEQFGSPDTLSVLGQTVEAFRAGAGADAYLVRSIENGGYSAGNNIGIRLAMEAFGAEYVLILNNDATVTATAVEAMLREAEDERVGVVVPLILYSDEHTIWYAGGTSILGTAFHFKRGRDISGTRLRSRSVKFATGCALLVKSIVFRDIGLLDERFFLYGEDVEFCRRVRTHWDIRFCADAKVMHGVSASTGGEGESHSFAYYGRRNHRFTAGGKMGRLLLFLAADAMFVVVPTAIRTWLRGNIWSPQLTLMLKGMRAALLGAESGKSAAV